MDIPAPGLDIGLQIGDTVDDGHGKSRSGLAYFSCLACGCTPATLLRRAVQSAIATLWHLGGRGFGARTGGAVMIYEAARR